MERHARSDWARDAFDSKAKALGQLSSDKRKRQRQCRQAVEEKERRRRRERGQDEARKQR